MLRSVPRRCLIVDDSVDFIRVSRGILEGDKLTVVGVATTAADGIQRARELNPDVVLVDIDLGEDSGLDLVRRLADGNEHAPAAILISTHPEEDFSDLIAESPAVGFVSKSDLSPAAIAAILG